MRHKVGDKVRVKSIDWYNANKDKSGEIYFAKEKVGFMPEMAELCGKEATIVDIVYGSYCKIDIDVKDLFWIDEMFESNEPKPEVKPDIETLKSEIIELQAKINAIVKIIEKL